MAAAFLLGGQRRRSALLWLAATAALIAAAATGYEVAYRGATGQSFFAGYLGSQLAFVLEHERHGLLRKLVNPLYYAANAAWFALPGVALALAAALRGAAPGARRATPRLVWPAVLAALTCLTLMSRHAMRYFFPGYPLLHLPGAEWLAQRPRARAWLERAEPWLPFALIALSPLLLAARVWFDLRHFRFVNPLGG
jgi:hypothetical protein